MIFSNRDQGVEPYARVRICIYTPTPAEQTTHDADARGGVSAQGGCALESHTTITISMSIMP